MSCRWVFVGMHARSRRNARLVQRANRRWLDLLDPADHDRAAALNPAENRRLCRRQGSPTPRPLQPPAPTAPARSAHRFRMALGSGNDVDCIALDFTRAHRFGLARPHSFPELLSHPPGIAGVQPQLPGNLRVW
jgi:hypothetical protein